MEQVKALNALEPFLALSKSAASPRAAADLVLRATSAPNTFIFSELLERPQIQALASSPEYSQALTLLEIFSYGTYGTYASTPGLPPLNEAQALKLRQLSILTLASERDSLGYSALMRSLDLPTARELESTVISAVYAGLVQAKLDPARQYVRVSSVAPLRDLAPGAVPGMIDALRAWSGRCASTLAELEAEVTAVREEAARRSAEQRDWDARVAKLMEEERQQETSGGSGAGKKSGHHMHQTRRIGFGKRASTLMDRTAEDVGDEAMDVDDDDETDVKKRAMRRKL